MTRRSVFLLFVALIFPRVAHADETMNQAPTVLADVDLEAGELLGWIWTGEGGPSADDTVGEGGWLWVAGGGFEGRTIPGRIVHLDGGASQAATLRFDRIEPVSEADETLLHWVSASVAGADPRPLCADANGHALPAVLVDDEVYGGIFACANGEVEPTRARPDSTITRTQEASGFTTEDTREEWTLTVQVAGFEAPALSPAGGPCVGCGD